MHIGLLAGSVRPDSSNQAALRIVEAAIVTTGHSTTWITGLEQLPAFDAAQVDNPPASVGGFQEQLRRQDGLVIAAPEYAAGLAGSTKNALDWLVGAASIYKTPVAVISAGTTGGEHAIRQLVLTLSWQGAWPMTTLGIAFPQTKMEHGEFVDTSTIDELTGLAQRLTSVVGGSADGRRDALVQTVQAFGVDPQRFGDIT